MKEQEIKQQVIDKLKGKTAHDYYKEYIEAEEKLIKNLGELENWGNECKCEDAEICNVIHEGEWSEIIFYCLNCGGYVNEEEWG